MMMNDHPKEDDHDHDHDDVESRAEPQKQTKKKKKKNDPDPNNNDDDNNGHSPSDVQQQQQQVASDRGQWSTGLEFLLSCISMSVGLGNVWRFPYIAYENGGGAFLIPYFLLLFLIGRPIYYMELILGQFSGNGAIKAWKCVPAIKGLGFAQLFSTAYIAIFYNYLMAISIYYFFASFQPVLPWTDCNQTVITMQNITCPEYYFERTVLNKSDGLWDLNSISWKLVLCLIGSWTLVYFSIVKGISSLGKVAYFTAIFPYTVLVTLLCVAVTQDGALQGIYYFFRPDFQKLLDPIVWYRAVEQSFFSLAVCFGSLVMYSSYNSFDNNVNRDAIIISCLDTVTSLLAGCVIFAVLGHMALEKGVPIDQVVSAGEGLAFIAYPEGLSKIRFVPQLWSILFFFMLFTLGIGSSVAMIETLLTSVKDEFRSLQKHKSKVALICCLIFFLLGIPLTTDAGPYIMMLLDNYGVGTAAFLYGIIEVCSIAYVYGLTNFLEDVHFMLKSAPSKYWTITWGFLTPLVLVVIFVYGNYTILSDSKTRPGIPDWGNQIGWGLAALAIMQIPLWMFITICQQKGSSWIEKFQLAFQSSKDWGPIDEKNYNEWARFKVDKSFNKVFRSVDADDFSPADHHISRNRGSVNIGFVPDEYRPSTSTMNSIKASQMITDVPRLLSNKKLNNE